MFARGSSLMWVVAMMAALVIAIPASASAMTMLQGDSPTVAKTEVISDDVYAFGNTITIDGNVDGDVVAFGQSVLIRGNVTGSVITAAQDVRIEGTVGGSVRGAGQSVDVSGRVGGDVLAGANQVTVPGDVHRDLVAGGQDVKVTGNVGRNVMTGSQSLVIDGEVVGNVEAQSTQVTVGKQGTVGGDLTYWSAEKAKVQGDVAGSTVQHQPVAKKNERPSGAAGVAQAILFAVIGWVQSLTGFLILGLFMVFVLRRPTQGGSQAILNRPWPSLGVGGLLFFVTPPVAIFVFILGLFVGAWWLSLVWLTVFWLLMVAGMVVGSLALGRAILGKASAGGEPALAWSVLLGLLVVWIVAAIPFIGWLAAWVVMMAGAGGLVLLWMGKAERPVPVTPAYAAPQAYVEPVQPPVQPSVQQPVQPPVAPPIQPPIQPPMA